MDGEKSETGPVLGDDQMTHKRYTVISALTPSGPEYRIYDRINECTIEGGFDTQKWAEAVAEMMEEKWKNDKRRKKKKA